MQKRKIILSVIIILILFVTVERLSAKKEVIQKEEVEKAIAVSTQSVEESKKLSQKIQYPASVVGDQEVQITAKSAGTITVAPGNIGSSIKAGALLAKIDDTSTLSTGDQGLKSLQVQQNQLSLEQAKKSYELAKDNYEDLKDSNDASDSEINGAKIQRDIAKLQYENASLGLTGSIDSHLMTSPIAGVIVSKAVSVGDSVSIGQPIATISKSTNIKVQFYVDASHRAGFVRGQEISVIDGNDSSSSFLIRNISAVADPATKRFLIEAYPQKKVSETLLAGTIATVSIQTNIKPQDEKNILLPLSAVSVGQNESYVFTVENNVAKKAIINVVRVTGETAEISNQFSPETLIITEGNKLVRDGETVTVQN
ncbi:MAG: efflux RND transporter periplasmic adaptor subunit [Candidatus Moranbacteria bacterium]|nr:efflux RND transporter periplasmic adaptor subunit [Candidatus Moranbacteria bacterium]